MEGDRTAFWKGILSIGRKEKFIIKYAQNKPVLL